VIADNLVKACGDEDIRFMTLTQRSFGASLTASLDKLIASFQRLRESFFWKTHVKGGAALIEVKRGSKSGQWHCHYHILSHGRFIDQRQLANAWLEASGDSFIVDIRYVRDKQKAVGYTCKYAASPLDPSCFENPLDLVECILALRGRRLCSTFGDWRGMELEHRDKDAGNWREVGPLDALIRRSETGDVAAVLWIQCLTGRRWAVDEERKASPAG
jgi:hypothetical protein